MKYEGMTRAEVATAANRYRDAEELRMPELTASSDKQTLLDWLDRLGDSEMPSDMDVDDAWATVANTVSSYAAPETPKASKQKLVLGRLV